MRRGLVTLGLAETDGPEPTPDHEGGPITAPLSTPPVSWASRPGSLAASALLHAFVVALTVELTAIVRAPSAVPASSAAQTRPADAVFLPAPDVLRQILGLRARPPARIAMPRGRISIGPPAPMRTPEPLVLHREDDLTAVAKGTSTAGRAPREAEAQVTPPRADGAAVAGGEGGRFTPPSATSVAAPGPILASLRRLEAGVGDAGPLGIPMGAGGQMGPLFFDPEGADFTAWIQRFKNEVYRNWIVPPSAALGWTGQVDFEFVVDRGGTITDVRLLESSGTGAYDRAARNALLASRLLPLPADFAPATVTMRVGFVYSVRAQEGGRSGR